MIVGSYVKDPKNTICRAWVWKVRLCSPDGGLIVAFMEVYMRVGLAWLAKTSIGVDCRVLVLGPHPRSLMLSSLSLLLDFLFTGGEDPFSLRSSSLLYWYLLSFQYPRVSFTFWSGDLSYQPIPRVIGSSCKSWTSWWRAWTCQA